MTHLCFVSIMNKSRSAETFRHFVQRRQRTGILKPLSLALAGLASVGAGVMSWGLDEDEGIRHNMLIWLGAPGILMLSLSLILATSWGPKTQQLWQEYVSDLRRTWLDPYYGQLDRARHILSQCGQLCEELWLESMEARYWLITLPVVGDPTLASYAGQVQGHHQQLAQLLPQLQDGIQHIESLLMSMEQELALYALGPNQPLRKDLAGLEEMDLLPVIDLSQDLAAAEGSLQGVSLRVERLFAQVWPSQDE